MQSRRLKYCMEVCIAVNDSALIRQHSLTSAVRLMVLCDPCWGWTEWFDENVLIFSAYSLTFRDFPGVLVGFIGIYSRVLWGQIQHCRSAIEHLHRKGFERKGERRICTHNWNVVLLQLQNYFFESKAPGNEHFVFLDYMNIWLKKIPY